jgi:CO/xanthine dehydrogenase Mo-binding subunit
MTAAISRPCWRRRSNARIGPATPKRLRDSRKAGKLRGRGIGCYLEVTAPPSNEMGGLHFEEDGTVTIVTGTLDYGQGHWTPFAQVLTGKLGVPFDKIRSCRAIATG